MMRRLILRFVRLIGLKEAKIIKLEPQRQGCCIISRGAEGWLKAR